MVFTVPVSLFGHFTAVLTGVGVNVELDFALIGGSSNLEDLRLVGLA